MKKTILDEIRGLLNFSKEGLESFIDVTTDDKTIRVEGDVLTVGLPVFVLVDEVATKVEDDSIDGTYETETQTFVVVGGVITEVMDKVVEEAQENSPMDLEMEAEVEPTKVEDMEEAVEEVEVDDEMTLMRETIASLTSNIEEFSAKLEEFDIKGLAKRTADLEALIGEMILKQEGFSGSLKEFAAITPYNRSETSNNFKTETITDSSNNLDAIRNIRRK